MNHPETKENSIFRKTKEELKWVIDGTKNQYKNIGKKIKTKDPLKKPKLKYNLLLP